MGRSRNPSHGEPGSRRAMGRSRATHTAGTDPAPPQLLSLARALSLSRSLFAALTESGYWSVRSHMPVDACQNRIVWSYPDVARMTGIGTERPRPRQ